MSLLKLLAAGKSLMGLKGASSRYEVSNQRLLPKFCARKNPFRASIHPQGKAEDVMQSSPNIVEEEPSGVIETTTAADGNLAEPETGVAVGAEPVTEVTPAAAAPQKPVSVQREMPFVAQVTRVRSWRIRIWEYLLARIPTLKRSPQLRAPRLAPVQRELCLDTVRVVRSDLTDCDVIPVAPVHQAPARSGAGRKAIQTLQRGTGAVMALERTAREIFGAQRVERR
jgi:hypothetical protein